MIRPEAYQEKGCTDRAEYLDSLAKDYGVPINAVLALAEVLGPDEDFDGLVSRLEDVMFNGWFDERDWEDDDDERLADAQGG